MFKLALHSVSYAGVWPGQSLLPLDKFIPRAAQLGFDAVMLMAKRPHLSLLDMGPAARRDMKKLADDSGVRVAVLAGYNDFAAGADVPDVPLREMQVYYIGELARLAADLGCPLIRVFTSFEREAVPYQTAWGHTASCLREAARRAADFGVTLGVQNHHDLAVHHESLADLLAEIGEPNCKACFDAWAPALQGIDPAAAVKRVAGYLAHTTVADYVRRPRFRYVPPLVNYRPEAEVVRAVPMGQGFIDYRAFFGALQEIGYRGHVAYEMCSPLQGGGSEANLDRCAAAFVKFMHEGGKAEFRNPKSETNSNTQ
jgi:sugar phosphate isomerase/epimerase